MKQDKFFTQSYSDALNDYIYSCNESKSENWDWIVLTAANKCQAESYKLQIERRKLGGWLPINTKLAIVPDYEDMRIGSGGATLNVIRYIAEKDGYEALLEQKILVIHSGGDSKRIPQYSVCGKLFAPVARLLPNGQISTIFDELLILASGIPNRIGKGIMVFPSDTELLFNPLQLDLLSCDAAGLSMKAPVTEGKNHGVFLQGEGLDDHRNRNVKKFFHKQPEAVLRKFYAVNDIDQVDIDTGCIWLGKKVVKALADMIFEEGSFNLSSFEKYVNPQICLNFYTDFVYPLAEAGTLNEFMKEAPENGFSEELYDCRRRIWETLHGYQLSLVKMVPARYIHFGMTNELFQLFVDDIDSYRYLGWENRINTNASEGTVINSFVSMDTKLTSRVFIEDCIITGGTEIGDGSIISNVDLKGNKIPNDVVLSGIKLKDGRYVCRIYGREDNPKESGNARFLNGTIEKLIERTQVSSREIWGERTASIWNAAIYPVHVTMREAIQSALSIFNIIEGTASEYEIKIWKNADKYSLRSSFYEGDVLALLNRKNKIKNLVKLENFYTTLFSGVEMSRCIDVLCKNSNKSEICQYVENIIKKAELSKFPDNMRLFLAASDICRKGWAGRDVNQGKLYEERAYESIKECISNETFTRFHVDYRCERIQRDEVEVTLPVRVNFCGSPSDAAPYCMEHGGTMIDGALLLNGKKPVKVIARRITDGITFGSKDQRNTIHYTSIRDIKRCGEPSDPFALHKAVLIAVGLIPVGEPELEMKTFCRYIGGGIQLDTQTDVPKGSGLGTSSIIAAAAIKAVHLLLGHQPSEEEIYAQVFLAEQLMNTGGGWQDQVGGLTAGVKYFTAAPGNYQKIEVNKLKLAKETLQELNSRFALIFSGQRRLARNVLREEMNQCIRNDRKALHALKQIQEYCAIMQYYLLKGDVTEFAKYISKQYELVKILDKGASNTCIDYIFEVCDDLVDGKSICGAGGGGFLQVILKEGITKRQLEERITHTFIDCGVEVWDCELI